ncbi:V-type proton ATPase subunit F [Seiridium cupressi]
MAASQADYKDRQFLAVIGDEVIAREPSVYNVVRPWLICTDTGLGNRSATGWNRLRKQHVTSPPDSQKNFLVVDNKTEASAIEAAFDSFTTERKDIGIILINQHIADKIRHRIDTYTAAFPTVLEIPSKEHPYDPEKDSVLRRVRRLFGE